MPVAFQTTSASAIAFQLLAALDAYDVDISRLARIARDPALFGEVASHMSRIQRCGASLPGVSVPAVALLISHAEFVYALWHRARFGEADSRDPAALMREHREHIEDLRKACLRLCMEQ
jgi:hypothetical protein